MHAKYRAASVGRRVSAFLILSGLVAVVLLLAGCSSIRQAAGATTQLALVTATPTPAGVPGVPTIDTTTASSSDPSAGPTADWTEAGQVTVTPASPDAAAAPQPAVTPEPEPTADGAATVGAPQPIQFTGKIENLPATGDWTGAWQVGGRLVRVAPGTTVDQRYGGVALGEQVTVEGWPQTDGSLDAVWVIVHGTSAGQPATTATPFPPAGTQPNAGSQSAPPTAAVTAPPAQQPAATAAPQGEEQGENDQNDGQNAQGQNHQGDDEQNEQDNQGNHPNQQDQQNNDAVNARPVELRDVVQSMPGNGLVGTWQIGGRTVNVNARTRLQKGAESVQPGAIVQVMGWRQPDGSINAAYLMVKKNMNAKGNAGNAGGEQGNGDGKGSGNGKGNGNNSGNDKGKGKGNGNGKGKGD